MTPARPVHSARSYSGTEGDRDRGGRSYRVYRVGGRVYRVGGRVSEYNTLCAWVSTICSLHSGAETHEAQNAVS